MTVERKRMARLFFYWCVQFLRSRYELTEIVFLAHTTEAREVDEEQFFGRVESGGTKVSSVFEAVGEIQRDRYGELLLEHRHEGLGLDEEYARGTLTQIALLWGKPCTIRTAKPDDPDESIWFAGCPDGASEKHLAEPVG